MRIVLLGPPGAGKGTLAGELKDKFKMTHISTGDIFREEMKSGSPLGKELKGYVESGKLVPDDVVTRIIEQRLMRDKDLKSYMLDGFPRTRKQAEDLDRILEKIHRPIDHVLYMEASLSVVVQRLTGRRVCRECSALYHMTNKPPKKEGVCDECGGPLYQRPDDNEKTIKTRMDVYLKNTMPIVEHYKAQGKLRNVDGNQNVQEVLNSLMSFLNESDASDHDQNSG